MHRTHGEKRECSPVSSSFLTFNFVSTIAAILVVIVFHCFTALLRACCQKYVFTKTEFVGSSEICDVCLKQPVNESVDVCTRYKGF